MSCAVDYILNLLCAFNSLQPMKKFVFSVASRATGRLQIKPSGSGDENERKHNVGKWPAHAPKRHTAGQESAPPMFTNNNKRYKRKHSHATALQTANTPPKNAKNTGDHSFQSLTTLNVILQYLTPASQVEVGCPWARGLHPQLHPKTEEHPQAYQPATQLSARQTELWMTTVAE